MQLAAQKPDDSFADIETQSNSLRGSVVVGRLVKRFEEVWKVLFRNAFPRVPYFESDLIAYSLDAHCNLACIGELDRIADEIVENLPKPDRICSDPVWNCAVQREGKTELLLTGS